MSDVVRKARKPFGYDDTRWCAYWWFVGWDCFSLGLHFSLRPNIEIHLPFGFIRIGRV